MKKSIDFNYFLGYTQVVLLIKTNVVGVAQVAEQVDAQDLKSCEIQPSCRFKSGLGHQFLISRAISSVG